MFPEAVNLLFMVNYDRHISSSTAYADWIVGDE